MGRLFGTDGARGVANTELTCEMALNIGRAAACVLAATAKHRPVFVIGKDTRVSSDMLEAAMVAGFCSVGADVKLLGVVPTPAVAYLVKQYGADAGVMISASHNPCEYNGIKLFNGEGYKLSDALEEQIEAIVLDGAGEIPCPSGGDVGRVEHCATAVSDYVRHLRDTVSVSLGGMKLAVDCANGSASATAHRLFADLGADCVFLNDTPNGVNINDNCGSTHMEVLTDYVKTHKCFGGVAFDGDADRCLAVDEQGNLIDGDKMIAALAVDMKQKGTLTGNAAVGTVLSNLGFFRCCEEQGIQAVAAKVGDRYVLETMLENGYMIGGEQSGHIILKQFATTGDGQLSAIQLLAACREKGCKLSALGNIMQRFPQVMLNVKADAAAKAAYEANTQLAAEIAAANDAMNGEGRVLVRPSGTEPLIRVMVEGRHFDEINRLAVALAEKIQAAI